MKNEDYLYSVNTYIMDQFVSSYDTYIEKLLCGVWYNGKSPVSLRASI